MVDDPVEKLLAAFDAIGTPQEIDERLQLLADPYVRYSLYILAEQSTTSLDQLADLVAGFEAAKRDTVVTPPERDAIRTRLYHAVLPKLDAADYVQFDYSDRTVTPTADTHGLTTFLDVLDVDQHS